MQIEVSEKAKEFEPVTLTLTLESADELRWLWHRLNVPWTNIADWSSFAKVEKPFSCTGNDLDNLIFPVVSKLAESCGLKR